MAGRQTRRDQLGYDLWVEIIGSQDAVTVELGRRTPLRSLESDAPAMPGPAWQMFLSRFETARGSAPDGDGGDVGGHEGSHRQTGDRPRRAVGQTPPGPDWIDSGGANMKL